MFLSSFFIIWHRLVSTELNSSNFPNVRLGSLPKQLLANGSLLLSVFIESSNNVCYEATLMWKPLTVESKENHAQHP